MIKDDVLSAFNGKNVLVTGGTGMSGILHEASLVVWRPVEQRALCP